MSITINLPRDVEAALRADAEGQGRDAADLAADLIRHRYAEDDGDADRIWWESLTPERQEEERAALRAGLTAIREGRTRPAEEVYARLRQGVPRQ